MVFLHPEINLDLIPRRQATQHANPPHEIASTRGIQVDRAPKRRVQARVALEGGGLRGSQRRGAGLVGERRVRNVVRHRHVVELQADGARAAARVWAAELHAEGAAGFAGGLGAVGVGGRAGEEAVQGVGCGVLGWRRCGGHFGGGGRRGLLLARGLLRRGRGRAADVARCCPGGCEACGCVKEGAWAEQELAERAGAHGCG